ncbi:MAG: SpoIIE family protein phosphatase [Planctomycetaceae bacterium]|nr:SpoIIE family protein phosphatase [Planctomycetaceae bacterium]
MAKSASEKKHLRLYTEQPPKPTRASIEAFACLPDLLRAFETATGWGLTCNRTNTDRNRPTFTLNVSTAAATKATSDSSLSPATERNAAKTLAGSITNLLEEFVETRHALWQREAELAAGVPVTPHRENEKHLAARLQAVLKAGAEAVDANAAALYLLDEATTNLKLRNAYGLPFERLLSPPRPLAGALADLEAMLGHVVVLDHNDDTCSWNMPEDFAAAACIPVSTPTTLLGTLWVFSNEKRDFDSRQTNILEVVAGRIASDLEREMLLRVGVDGAKVHKQLAAAERRQQNELPTVAPLFNGWDVAGATAQADNLGGALHDWFSLPDGLLALAVGRADEEGVGGALTATALKTAIRAHACYGREPESVLKHVNMTLWTGSAGDRHAAMLFGLVDTESGRVSYSAAGGCSIIRLNGDGWESLTQPSPGLGRGPEADVQSSECQLEPGEVLLVCTDTVGDAVDSHGRRFGEAQLASALQGRLQLSADELLALARGALEGHTGRADGRDQSFLLIKRG